MAELHSLSELAKLLHKSYNAMYFDTQTGTFPQAVKVDSSGIKFYDLTEVLEWYRNPPTNSIPIIGGYQAHV